ncbi:MAG: hypothetical protein E7337_07390 [Clostridiales bacterium]|nr:hypothetical protein [Clostridiales bacterium]
MPYNRIFQIVKKYIDALDYYALLEGGAPDDEFDIESQKISVMINADSSVSEIAEVIAKVFEEYFGNKENPDVYYKLAGDIKRDLLQKE